MAFSERLAPRTTTQVVETSLTQNKTVKERKEKKREKYRSEDDEAGHSTCFSPGERPSTTQHGNVTVGTVLKTTLVLAKSPNLC